MKRLLIAFLITFYSLGIAIAQNGYWYDDRYIELKPVDTHEIYLQPRIGASNEDIKSFDEGLKNTGNDVKKNFGEEGGVIVSRLYSSEWKNTYKSDIYVYGDFGQIIVLPRISLELKDESDINDVISSYELPMRIRNQHRSIYRLDCEANTSDEIFEVISRMHQDKRLNWAEPVIITNAKRCNTLYGDQYYLKNTGQGGGTATIDINVEPAWAITTGNKNITVAVIDDGIDSLHIDLADNMIKGYTIDNPTGYGQPQNWNTDDQKTHGTNCAGILGAVDNQIGIKGVVPVVNMLPVNIDVNYHNGSQMYLPGYDKIADAFRWAYQRADVINLSMHFAESNDISAAIHEAVTQGRNGNGTIVVASSGNYYSTSPYNVAFPASLDDVIAVGGLDKNGAVAYYSQRGVGLNVVAIGGDVDIVTTQRVGLGDGYRYNFGGTAAACPQVSGIVALMLSINPYLTVDEIKEKLYASCRQLPQYAYSIYGWSFDIGYGLVDAYASVLACKWNIEGSDVPCGSSVYYVDRLPSDCQVTWFWKNSSGPSISQNTPSANRCTITNNNKAYINDTLIATIYRGADIVTSLKKEISTGAGFHGTYSQDAMDFGNSYIPYYAPVSFDNGESITPFKGSEITITSDQFYSAQITYSGTAPLYFNHSGNTVTLKFSYRPPLVPLSRGNDAGQQRLSSCTITGTYLTNCNTFQFTIIPMRPFSNDFSDVLQISNNGQVYTIGLDTGDRNTLNSSTGIAWHLTIINYVTGRTMCEKDICQNATVIDTNDWDAGIYVIRVLYNGEVLTKKFIIK